MPKKRPVSERVEQRSSSEKRSKVSIAKPRWLLVSSYTEVIGHVKSPSCPHKNSISVYWHVPPHDEGGSGHLLFHSRVTGIPNASYMCANAEHNRIYVVSETNAGNEVGNLVFAYAFDKASGKMTFMNSAETGGAAACHLAVTPDGKHVAIANYLGGSVALFRLKDDGSIGERADFVQHKGSSNVNTDRQEGPHAHQALFDASGTKVLVPDLGLDQVLTYSLKSENSKLLPGPSLKMLPGSGPRHMALHPNGRFAFVLNELLSTVVPCKFDAAEGVLTALSEPLNSAPEGSKVGMGGETFCAAIRVSPDGRFIYTSNRGHDSITVFEVSADGHLNRKTCQMTSTDPNRSDRELCPPDEIPCSSPSNDCPRDFALCGDNGECLVVGNQDSDEVVIFARDVESGIMSPTGHFVKCAAPACILPLF